jgi:hypothetical protein
MKIPPKKIKIRIHDGVGEPPFTIIYAIHFGGNSILVAKIFFSTPNKTAPKIVFVEDFQYGNDSHSIEK